MIYATIYVKVYIQQFTDLFFFSRDFYYLVFFKHNFTDINCKRLLKLNVCFEYFSLQLWHIYTILRL